MAEFQRSPSKVWWNEYAANSSETWYQNRQTPPDNIQQRLELPSENRNITSPNHSRENSEIVLDWPNRTASGSPNSHKSQDSGFSDSETSPFFNKYENDKLEISNDNKCTEKNDDQTKGHLSINLLKDLCTITETPQKNFTTNIKEKYSPKKTLACKLHEEKLSKSFSEGSNLPVVRDVIFKSLPSTPKLEHLEKLQMIQSEDVCTYVQTSSLVNHFSTPEKSYSSVTCHQHFKEIDTNIESLCNQRKLSPMQVDRLNQTISYSPNTFNEETFPDSSISNRQVTSNQITFSPNFLPNHTTINMVSVTPNTFLNKSSNSDVLNLIESTEPNQKTHVIQISPNRQHIQIVPSPISQDSKKHNSIVKNRKCSPRHSPRVNRNLLTCFSNNGNSINDLSRDESSVFRIVSNDSDRDALKTSKIVKSSSEVSTITENEYSISQELLRTVIENECDFENNNYSVDSDLSSLKCSSIDVTINSPQLSKTVPYREYKVEQQKLNKTAPAGDELKFDPNQISFEEMTYDATYITVTPEKISQSMDDISQCSDKSNENCLNLKYFQLEQFALPVVTSTPKVCTAKLEMRRPRSPKNSTTSNNESDVLEQDVLATTNSSESVQQWVTELRYLYEPECMVTLQSKSLAAELQRRITDVAEKTTATLKALTRHSKVIREEFDIVLRQLSKAENEHIEPLLQSVVGNVTEFIVTYNVSTQAGSLTDITLREKGVHEMLEACDFLRSSINRSDKCAFKKISEKLEELKKMFDDMENGVLRIQIQMLVNMVEEPSSEIILRAAIQSVSHIASKDIQLVNLLTRCGALRALLGVCLDSRGSTIRASALRAISTICCTSLAVRHFEQVGGIEIIADILTENIRPEPELSEATAVIAQITAPWIEDNHSVRGLKENTKSLVKSLTDLLENTQCCQTLLLCAAALANISSMEPTAVWPLLQYSTAEKLLTAVQKRGPKASIFLKEQTATLLANMSAASESRVLLGDSHAAAALLYFLQVNRACVSTAEYAAGQRLQQKAAIALSRLCTEKTIAQQIVDLNGVSQLVRLCKEKKERSHSDAVLVACLATLRKITSKCGLNVMDQEDAMELVEPKLLDSFLTYSSQNESYV